VTDAQLRTKRTSSHPPPSVASATVTTARHRAIAIPATGTTVAMHNSKDGAAPASSASIFSRTLAWLVSPAGIVLVLLVMQSTSIVLLMRYSKTVTRPAEAGPAYASTVAIFMAEVFKLPFCLAMAAWATRNHGGLGPVLYHDVLVKWQQTCKCGVPAIAYTIQGNLLFVALANLQAPTYQVTYQCKTLFTAVFSRVLLDKRLQHSQWVALVLLVAGAVLASDLNGKGKAQQGSLPVGLGAVVSAGLLSASSSVYFEKMLKTPFEGAAAQAGLWLRNIQLGSFALPLSAVAMLLKDGEQIQSHGLLQGFDNGVVWAVVLLNGCGGLLVAATMKYADNIVKCFATAIAIIAGTLLSVPIFGFAPSPLFLVGAPFTVAATVLYSAAPKRLLPCLDLGPAQPEVEDKLLEEREA